MKNKTIKFICLPETEEMYLVHENPKLENLTLMQILKKIEVDDDTIVDVYYVEDCEKISKLEEIDYIINGEDK